jgi:hypothetical protein
VSKAANPPKATPIPFGLPCSTAVFGALRIFLAHLLPATWLRKLADCPKLGVFWRDIAMEAYVVGSTIVLGWLFWRSFYHPPARGCAAVAVTAFIVFRLAEMLAAGIELLAGELSIEAATAAAVVVIYLLQTLLSFTLLAQHNGMFLNDDGNPPPGPVGYLFTIWGYVSTIGSTYAPRNVLATIIAMSAGLYSLLLLGVFLAYAVGSLQNRFGGGNQPSTIALGGTRLP